MTESRLIGPVRVVGSDLDEGVRAWLGSLARRLASSMLGEMIPRFR